MKTYNKEALEETLLRIDEEASLALDSANGPFRVIIVGGSALLLSDLTHRSMTHDIDVLHYDAALREIIGHYRVVNNAVAAYMDCIPYNFEDRLRVLDLPTRTVVFCTPSLEDLAVMKLYGWRGNDIEDLESEEFLAAVNWDVLDRLVLGEDEAKASALSPRRYREMVSTYMQYARRHNHEPHL